jgi:hypothetical protein
LLLKCKSYEGNKKPENKKKKKKQIKKKERRTAHLGRNPAQLQIRPTVQLA